VAGRVQGLPGAASTCWWMVGRNAWFQLEFFQFCRPMAQLMPADFRPCDIGYTRLGISVADFDATLANLARLGTQPLTSPLGAPGRRHACVRSPDGVYVEIMEDDPLPTPAGRERTDCPAAVRAVTLSTPDLDASVAYFTALNGKGPEEIALHTAEHEALWGLAGARGRRAVFRSGDVLVEVMQYLEPLGKARPQGYRICDQGILNIAYGARNRRDHTSVYERARAFGATPNCDPVHLPGAGVVYVNDRLGFSVEVLWMAPGKADRDWGFEPRPVGRRPDPDNERVVGRVRIAAPLDRVWAVLNDHDHMSAWIGFNEVRVIREGVPARNGYGCERLMKGAPGTVVEQVTGVVPKERIRYRVIQGSPFVYHNGEIELRPNGGETEVTWSIRFRGKRPFTGALLRPVMASMLTKMMRKGLKPYAERHRGAQTTRRADPS